MTNEKITFIKPVNEEGYAGYKVITTEQVITFGIANESNCCEQWVYFMTNDDAQEFINARLIDVTIVDSELNSKVFIDRCEHENINPKDEDCQMMFVNFTTSKGVLQFVAYNRHNGYYSHLAFIRSRQLTEEKYL